MECALLILVNTAIKLSRSRIMENPQDTEWNSVTHVTRRCSISSEISEDIGLHLLEKELSTLRFHLAKEDVIKLLQLRCFAIGKIYDIILEHASGSCTDTHVTHASLL